MNAPFDKTVLPSEFLARMRRDLGGDFDAFYSAYDGPCARGLRINTLKAGVDGIKLPFALSPVPWCKDGFYYDAAIDAPGRHVFHDAGAYYVQEPSAMSVVEAADVREGERILDLCAAPGGKSTQIAQKLKATGLLVANEILSSRAAVLSENIERMGIVNALVTCASPQTICERWHGAFDKVFVDAPCSGEGMFRKNVAACREWSVQNVETCARRQAAILDDAARAVADGGALIYSTCTFSRAEDEDIVDAFLEKHGEFELKKSEKLLPHICRGEGHFFAVMVRGDGGGGPQAGKAGRGADKKSRALFEAWRKDNISTVIEPTLAFGDTLFAAEGVDADLSGLKVLRAGLELGRVRSGRFEPSHALAMSIGADDAARAVEVGTGEEAVRYLAGETLADAPAGWNAVCFDALTAGWAKGTNNKYPKALRRR